jgi:hypothetical protein
MRREKGQEEEQGEKWGGERGETGEREGKEGEEGKGERKGGDVKKYLKDVK